MLQHPCNPAGPALVKGVLNVEIRLNFRTYKEWRKTNLNLFFSGTTNSIWFLSIISATSPRMLKLSLGHTRVHIVTTADVEMLRIDFSRLTLS